MKKKSRDLLEILTKKLLVKTEEAVRFTNQRLAFSNQMVPLFHAKDFAGAIDVATRAIRENSKIAYEMYSYRAKAYTGLKKYNQAIADATLAIELAPNYAGFYDTRGLVYERSGNFKAGISDFSRAIELDPSGKQLVCTRSLNGRGTIYFYQGIMNSPR